MNEFKIIEVNENNIQEYPPKCFLNPKNEGYQIKLDWLKKRFLEGLKIKQLYLENENKCNGFIEYVPGEYAWRAVDAKGYLFIHCIWISPNKYKEKGYASILLNEVINEADNEDKLGVAVVCSEGSFMAGKELFLKNEFESIEYSKPYDLIVKTLKKGHLPKFKDWKKQLKKYKGLNIIYSNQCPWVSRSIDELAVTAKEYGLKLKVIELKTAKDAQNAPSIYSSFNLVYDGKLLSDHYISKKRFQNIIKKEFKK